MSVPQVLSTVICLVALITAWPQCCLGLIRSQWSARGHVTVLEGGPYHYVLYRRWCWESAGERGAPYSDGG